MNEKSLIERLNIKIEDIPDQIEVLAVRQFSLDDLDHRIRHLLRVLGENSELNLDRGDWIQKEDCTLIRLYQGARMRIYHPSGAIRLVTGLNPMESIFENMVEKDQLINLVDEVSEQLNISEWVGLNDKLVFEHLWQIKASAADLKGRIIDPILCRVVGTYRHFINRFPILGPASVAIKLADGGKLDSLDILVRESTGEEVDQVQVIHPEQAAQKIISLVSGLMGQKGIQEVEGMKPSSFEFGYLSLPKRKAQQVLAPVYAAGIEIDGELTQAYHVVVPASDREFMAMCSYGSEANITHQRV